MNGVENLQQKSCISSVRNVVPLYFRWSGNRTLMALEQLVVTATFFRRGSVCVCGVLIADGAKLIKFHSCWCGENSLFASAVGHFNRKLYATWVLTPDMELAAERGVELAAILSCCCYWSALGPFVPHKLK